VTLVAYLHRLEDQAGVAARYTAVGLGFATIVSTALTSTLMAVLLLAWLLSGGWEEKLRRIRSNPVAVMSLALLMLSVVGILWSQGSADQSLHLLNKHLKLLLIPILATVMVDPADRHRGLIAMAAGLMLTLVLSYALWLRILPSMPPHIIGTPDNPMVFRKYLAQNTLVAYGVLLFAAFAWRATSKRTRWLWTALAVLAAFNVLFMVPGRTGQLALAAIAVVALFMALRWRGIVLAVVGVSAAFVAAYSLAPGVRERLAQVPTEVKQWDPNVASSTSVGLRLEFYRNTLTMIGERPLLGAGTGGFGPAYDQVVAGKDLNRTSNPHNQYLLTTAELGLVGLAVLLFFFFQHGRASGRLPDPVYCLLARGLLTLMVLGCTVNSLLLDHAEGVFFSYLTGLLFAGLPPRSSV